MNFAPRRPVRGGGVSDGAACRRTAVEKGEGRRGEVGEPASGGIQVREVHLRPVVRRLVAVA